MNTIDKVKLAKEASIQLAACGTELKNRALEAVAAALREEAAAILAANKTDLAAAEAAGLTGPLLKRLAFDKKKLEGVIEGVESLVKLEDPVGKKLRCTELDEGLVLTKVSCPIGVIGVIFESRQRGVEHEPRAGPRHRGGDGKGGHPRELAATAGDARRRQ